MLGIAFEIAAKSNANLVDTDKCIVAMHAKKEFLSYAINKTSTVL